MRVSPELMNEDDFIPEEIQLEIRKFAKEEFFPAFLKYLGKKIPN
jgi:hypothetical protein